MPWPSKGDPASHRVSGSDADGDQNGVGRDRPPVGQHERADRSTGDSRQRLGDRDAELHAHALRPVHRTKPVAEAAREHVRERHIGRLDQRDVGAQPPRGGGNLLADEACANDRQPRARHERGAQADGVGERAQHVHVRPPDQRRQPPRAAPRRDEQRVIPKLKPVLLQHHPPRTDVEPSRGPPEQQLDVLLVVPRRRPERWITPARKKQFLRERRPVVRCDRLRADDPDAPAMTTGAQGLDRALGGEAAADDEDAGVHPGMVGGARPSAGKAEVRTSPKNAR